MTSLLPLLPILAPGMVPFVIHTAWADGEGNEVHFAVQETVAVSNRVMVVEMAAEARGADPAAAAAKVNADMAWALAEAKRFAVVWAQTGNYESLPQYADGKPDGWRIVQGLQLRGEDPIALSRLTGLLQSRLQVSAMHFMPLEVSRRQAEDQAMQGGLAEFRRRAGEICHGLGFNGYRILQVDVRTNAGAEPPVPMVAMAKVVPVAVSLGENRISVTVTGWVRCMTNKHGAGLTPWRDFRNDAAVAR